MQESKNAIPQSIVRFVRNGQDFDFGRRRTRRRNSRFVQPVEKTGCELGTIYMQALCFICRYEDTGLDMGEWSARWTSERIEGMVMTNWVNWRRGALSNSMCAGGSTLLFLG